MRAARETGHIFETVQEAGWAGKKNGELLYLAESQFDVLITLDTNLQYQQRLAARTIAIIVIRAKSNRLTELHPFFPACIKALDAITPGTVTYVGRPD